MHDLHEEVFRFFEDELPRIFKGNQTEIRHQQISMAQYITHSAYTNTTSVIEAKVGTGTTLAYLFPMLKVSKKKEAPIIIATSSITLQEQILNNDLHVLKKLGYEYKAIVAKGAQQYFCKQNYHMNYDQLSQEQQAQIDIFRTKTKTGDRSEVGELSDRIWSLISIKSTKDCSGCPYRTDCVYWKQREEFKNSDNNLIITNHQQLLQDLRNRSNRFDKKSLFPLRIAGIVIDEAHNLEQASIQIFSRSVSINSLYSIAKRLLENRRIGTSQKQKTDYLSKISAFISHVQKQSKESRESIRMSLPLSNRDFFEQLMKIVELYKDIQDMAHLHLDDIDPLVDQVEERYDLLKEVLLEDKFVSWYEPESKNLVILTKAVSEKTNNLLSIQRRSGVPIIFTSATISSNQSFDYFYRSIGLDPNSWDNHEVELSSPFNYEDRAILYIGEDLPQYQYDLEDYDNVYNVIDDRIVELLNISQGCALILFTSHAHMQRSYDAIKTRIPWKTISQSEGSKEHISKLFKNSTEPTVLFGTGAFWEGFDVPGEQLINVIIVRIPFSANDPYLRFRQEEAELMRKHKFYDVVLPEAIIKIKQGFGRLIRRKDDFGMVAILDVRVLNRPYGETILNALPSAKRTSSLDEVLQFFAKHQKAGISEKPTSLPNDYSRDLVQFVPIPVPEKIKEVNTADILNIQKMQKRLNEEEAVNKSKIKPLPTQSWTERTGHQTGSTKYSCMICGTAYMLNEKPEKCQTPGCQGKNLQSS